MRETWPDPYPDGPQKAEDAFLMRHACSIRVFNVRMEACLRRTPERVIPDGQASHRFRCGAFTVFPPARQDQIL